MAPDPRPRILLVDDDDDTRQLMAFAMTAHGHEVTEAADGHAALAALRQGAFDLVISDYDLPGLTGAEMLRRAHAEGILGKAATLVVTAHPEPQGVPEETPLLRKPLDLERLLVQVRMILPHGSKGTARKAGAPALDLALYVSPHSPASLAARRRMDQVLAEYDQAQVRFQVCDLFKDAASAEKDRVVFTPTLVKRRPGPRAWIVGDFGRDDVVRDLLDMCGVARRG